MSTSKLEEVLQEVKMLTPEEQQKVRELLESLANEQVANDEANQSASLVTEEEFEKMLLAKGRIKRVPSRVSNLRDKDFKPIEVKGKPLSEIIIEERR